MKILSLFLMMSFVLLGLNDLYAKNKVPTVLFMGDSLTEGYGLKKKDTYANLIEAKLKEEGHPIKLINGSISGSTSASSLSRLKWFLKAKPSILYLALGANDALRGVKASETKKNLAATIKLAKENNITVLLCEMKTPPNYGGSYSKDFEKLYKELARVYQVQLIPFILHEVAGVKELNQNDGIHPNEKGNQKIFKTVYPHILRAVKAL